MRKAAAQPAAGLWFDRIFRGDKWVHVVWKCFRVRGFDAALIGGTVAGICCESSARNAMMRQKTPHLPISGML